MRRFGGVLKTILCGFCMGAADLVPGVSGGTVALILGIYEKLIQSIKSVAQSWDFLLALLSGIAIAFLTLAHFFHYLLGHELYRTFLFASFFGLIIASVFFCSRQVKKWGVAQVIATLIGAAIAFALTSFNPIASTNETLYNVPYNYSGAVPVENYDASQQQLIGVTPSTLSAMVAKGEIAPSTQVYPDDGGAPLQASVFVNRGHLNWINPWILGCGMVAICAMLLPGISGSYVLVILGVYPLFVGAVADFSHSLRALSIDVEAFIFLSNLGLGALLGALIFSRIISWLLNHYHSITMAALIGMMVGALRAIWPFWSYSYTLIPLKLGRGPQLQIVDPFLPPLTSHLLWGALLFALLGFCLVTIAERIAHSGRLKEEEHPLHESLDAEKD